MNRSLIVAATIAGASVVLAGPLDPPAGPVSSTMKTLDQVEPRTPIESLAGDATALYVIFKPGSYYLTGNLTGVASKAGILVKADHVSIDLCGHAVVGVLNSTSGISVEDGRKAVVVRNGTVRNWGISGGGTGVRLGLASSAEDLIVTGSNGVGIFAGDGSTIINCIVDANVGDGIVTQRGCSLSGCTASLNLSDGFTVGDNTTAENCAAYNNDGKGFTGPSCAVLEACTAASNGSDGFLFGTGAVFRSCASRQNAANGYTTGTGANIEGCTAADNDGHGFHVSSGSTIHACTSFFNTLDGIRCVGFGVIEHNVCDNNGNGGVGAGIHCAGVNTRIDSNTCIDNDVGFLVGAADNLIIRNSATGNPINWNIVANNKVGPIVLAPNSVAISGDTGGAGVGSTNPWANFTY